VALDLYLKDFEIALYRLKESYNRAQKGKREDDYYFFRDSAIQRFEFTVEIFWKTIKVFLKEREGIDCRTPKACIRGFFSAGHINEEDAILLLEMIDDRNLTSHTYKEEIAEAIFSRLYRYIEKLNEVIFNLKGNDVGK